MPRAFCHCIVCNKPGEIDEAPPEGSAMRAPPGWVSILAVYWPAGTALPPLPLRLCGNCFLRTLTAAHPRPRE